MIFLPRNKAADMLRSVVNRYLKTKRPVFRYGQVLLESTSLLNLYGNREVNRKDSEYTSTIIELGPFKSVLDIGCHTGNFPHWLLNHGAIDRYCRVLAVDANDTVCKQAERNLARNGFRRFFVRHGAVAFGNETHVRFHCSSVDNSSAVVHDPACPGKLHTALVPRIDFASLAETFECVNVDIEGAEFDLFCDSLPNCIKAAKLLIVEWHEPFCNLTWLRDRLQQHAFNLLEIVRRSDTIGLGYFVKRN